MSESREFCPHCHRPPLKHSVGRHLGDCPRSRAAHRRLDGELREAAEPKGVWYSRGAVRDSEDESKPAIIVGLTYVKPGKPQFAGGIPYALRRNG
jgi:hypothetical protein